MAACQQKSVTTEESIKQGRAQMPDPKTYKQHFENKHPKHTIPDDLKDV
ncbi:PREDICTED: zinc finger protein 706-like [Priapulus caudatus]|uniref:Zinc finger protein 706-like n=1 Tax=Priapulus caudatus TaxID=37621 RepID=A0ABM1E0J3_PRICU|nr:PREDICTED: zinc finger protein 706-like [Priapulus caudatus]